MFRRVLVVYGLVAGLASCANVRSQSLQAELGAESTLAPQAVVAVKAGIQVQFVSIVEDSRCPRDVTCVWAGETKARVLVRIDKQTPTSHDIVVGQPISIGAYRISVVAVQPHPVSAAKIKPNDYRAIIKVEKP